MSAPRNGVYWLLPVAFVVHDAEELFTIPAWVVAHQAELGPYAEVLPTTIAQTGVAMALLFAVFLVVTIGVWLHSDSFTWRALYGGVLGVFFIHAFTHALQAVAFRGYTPGVVTAFLVVMPASIYIGRTLLRRGALDFKASVIATLVGFVLFVPALLAAFRISRWLVSS
jgi:hypothetical protein